MMSQKFKAGVDNTVVSYRGEEKSLIEISDHRLLRLISGVEAAIDTKKTFIEEHFFPDAGSRYLDELKESIERLEERLIELTTEKDRRGI